MKADRSQSIGQILKAGFSLLSLSERRRAVRLGFASIVVGGLDMVALATTMPFIGLLIDPGKVRSHPLFARYGWFLADMSETSLVVVAGVISLALVATSGLLSFTLQRRYNRFTSDCQSRLARDLLDELVHAPYSWFLTINSGVIAHVFQRDVFVWSRELVLKTQTVFRDLIMIVFPAILVVIVVPLVGVATIIGVGLGAAALLAFTRPRIEALVAVKQAADERAHLLASQALAGVKDVKLSGREAHFIGQFAKSYGAYSSSQARLANWHQVPTSFIMLAGQMGLFLVALVLWWANADHGALAPQLALLVLVTSRILPAASRLSSSTTVLFGVMPAIRSIVLLRDSLSRNRPIEAGEPSVQRSTGPWRKVEMGEVNFAYPSSDTPALASISLTIEAGRAYGVVGPSGAGKSTLVDILLGLLSPSSGVVHIDGKALGDMPVRAWQRRIGYVAQSPFISDDTLGANIAFGVPPTQVDYDRLRHAISMASLEDLVAQLPDGISTPLGERGVRLSGGQRQRIAIARALYDEADLLVLDEATSALDNVSERIVQEAIERLRGRIATVTIAHRLSTVRNCDCIFVVEGGRLAASGTYEELLSRSQTFRAMVEAAESGQDHTT